MGLFDLTKTVDKFGTIKSNEQYVASFHVDIYGTLRGSTQFVITEIQDIFGNIGVLPATGPWEVQVGTVETVGTDMSVNPNNYSNFTTFASEGCTGILAGNLSAVWTVQGGTQTIGGTSYLGGGLIIVSASTITTGSVTVQTGANIQVGTDPSNVAAVLGGLTVQANAIATLYNSSTVNKYITQALNNTGIVNIEGSGVCGEGQLLSTTVANNGIINLQNVVWRNQSTMSGTGVINIPDGATFRLTTNAIPATQTLNLNGCGWCNASGLDVGALEFTSDSFTLNAKVNIQSPSCIKSTNVSPITIGGVMSGNQPLTIGTTGGSVGHLMTFSNTTSTYNGTMTVDGITLNQASTSLQNAKIVLVNSGRVIATSATIGSLATSDTTTYLTGSGNTTILNNGITQFDGRLLWNGTNVTHNIYLKGGSQNELTLTAKNSSATIYVQTGARLILQGATLVSPSAGQLRVSGSTVSAGTSTDASVTYLQLDATSTLEVRASGAGVGLLSVGSIGLALTAGWKVDLPDVIASGTYPILKSVASGTVLPTTGINNTGLTATYSWNNTVSPRVLNMTLN